jgi:hypothetical protein
LFDTAVQNIALKILKGLSHEIGLSRKWFRRTDEKFKIFPDGICFLFAPVFSQQMIKEHGCPESHLQINLKLRRGFIGGFFSTVLLCYARASHRKVFSKDFFSSGHTVELI